MSVLFISHRSHDNAVATALGRQLRAAGYVDIFLDFDPADGIPAGRNWEKELYTQLEVCDGMVLLWGDRSPESKWCFAEITHARAQDKTIVPVKIGTAELPDLSNDAQALDLTGPQHTEPPDFSILIDQLKRAGLRPRPFVWSRDRPPYPGLVHFAEADAAVFFGRDKEVGRLRAELNRARSGSKRFVAVLGASGSGKSSLVRAGLVPWLRNDPSWVMVEPFRPGVDAFDAMASAIAASFKKHGALPDWKDLRDRLESCAAGLEAAGGDQWSRRVLNEAAQAGRFFDWCQDLRNAADRREAAVLVIVDQLEEKLNAGENENNTPSAVADRSRFLALLRGAAEWNGTPIVVLCTLRSDFLGTFQTAPPLSGMEFVPVPLGLLPTEAFRDVILRPAALARLRVDQSLAEALIADTHGSDALPLLAFTLRELWEKYADDGRLTLSEYRDGLGGLQESVARAADEVLDQAEKNGEFGTTKRRLLNRTLLSMVQTSTDSQPTRLTVRWADQPTETHEMIRSFVRRRLFVSREQDSEPLFEVAHEAMFRSWKAMADLISANRDLLLWRRRMRDRLEDFHKSGGVLVGPLLVEARGWRLRQGDLLLDEENALILASEKAEQREKLRVRTAIAVAIAVLVVVGNIAWNQRGKLNAERTRSSGAEFARRRLLAAAACNCALVRPTLPQGGRIVAITRERDVVIQQTPERSWEDDNAESIESSKLSDPGELVVDVHWFGNEALLPRGDYRIVYEAGSGTSVFGVHSEGVGNDRVITLPAPLRLAGFTYVAGGECSNSTASSVSPFFVARVDSSAQLTWADANCAAFSRGSRLPNADELVCAARLAVDGIDAAALRWTDTTALAPQLAGKVSAKAAPALFAIVRGRVVHGGVANGLAALRLARSAFPSAQTSQAQLRLVSPVSDELARCIVNAWNGSKNQNVLLSGRPCEAPPIIQALLKQGIPLDAIHTREPESEDAAIRHRGARGVRVSIESAIIDPTWRQAREVQREAPSCEAPPKFGVVRIPRNRVEFEEGTSKFVPRSYATLKVLIKSLVENKNYQLVEIRVHAFDAAPGIRMALSRRRAEAVRHEFIAGGVAAARLIAKAMGDASPIGCTPELAGMLGRDAAVEYMRRTPAWSQWAEKEYLLGQLADDCEDVTVNNRVEIVPIRVRDDLDLEGGIPM